MSINVQVISERMVQHHIAEHLCWANQHSDGVAFTIIKCAKHSSQKTGCLKDYYTRIFELTTYGINIYSSARKNIKLSDIQSSVTTLKQV